MKIIKIGGSIITNKSKKDSFRKETMDEISVKLSGYDKDFIIVHGAGSYGHILAKEYNLNNGFKNRNQLKGFSETLTAVQELNSLILRSLQRKNINAVSISPHLIIKLKNHKPLEFNYKIFNDFLENGFKPVTFGDVVLDTKLGFSICSGDLLILLLSEYYKPDCVIFLFDEDGLYTSNPKKNKNAKFIEEIDFKGIKKLSTTLDNHADVTGGMSGKIEIIKKLSKKGINTYLVNGNKPERLYKILNKEKTKYTIIKGE